MIYLQFGSAFFVPTITPTNDTRNVELSHYGHSATWQEAKAVLNTFTSSNGVLALLTTLGGLSGGQCKILDVVMPYDLRLVT